MPGLTSHLPPYPRPPPLNHDSSAVLGVRFSTGGWGQSWGKGQAGPLEEGKAGISQVRILVWAPADPPYLLPREHLGRPQQARVSAPSHCRLWVEAEWRWGGRVGGVGWLGMVLDRWVPRWL